GQGSSIALAMGSGTAETLREVARVLSSSFDPHEVLPLVLAELRKLINYDTATIMLVDGSLE
ncbi:hypothetical protein, partial [Klebsiella pneumoniae]|uniref:hypothetical protein n=1 Tax=Klebsiella pneumoniae TaxID=573 RepID=UPI001953AE01